MRKEASVSASSEAVAETLHDVSGNSPTPEEDPSDQKRTLVPRYSGDCSLTPTSEDILPLGREVSNIGREQIDEFTVPQENNLQVNQKVRFQASDDDTRQWYTVRLKSRAGKAKGKYKQSYVGYDSPEKWKGCNGFVDFEREVACWENVDDSVLLASGVDDYLEAKQAEQQKWRDLGVYQEVSTIGHNCVGTTWVLGEKNGNKS